MMKPLVRPRLGKYLWLIFSKLKKKNRGRHFKKVPLFLYLCLHEKIRGCHSALAHCLAIHLLTPTGHGGECAGGMSCGGAVRTQEVLYGHRHQGALCSSRGVRDEGHRGGARFETRSPPQAIRVLGVAFHLLFMYVGRCL